MKHQAPWPTAFSHPETFQSRGIAAPFTTPLLAGARIRNATRSGLEVVIPNPSGGRGAYIMPASGVRAICHPSVHDTLLLRRCARLTRIDPAGVRDIALEVAAEGYAGQAAAAAATITRDADRAQSYQAHFHLLAALIRQAEPAGHRKLPRAEHTAEFERRAKQVLHRIAPSLGCNAARLPEALAQIGDAFTPIGVAGNDRAARIPRLIARIRQTHADLSHWLAADPAVDIGGLGQIVTTTMELAHDGGAAVHAAAWAALADPIALLRQFLSDPSPVLDLTSRADWLLDGWDQVCLLWIAAGSTASRRAALLEMAQFLPLMPLEIGAWIDLPLPREAIDPACRVISQDDAWRRGAHAIALIQRNETLSTMRT